MLRCHGLHVTLRSYSASLELNRNDPRLFLDTTEVRVELAGEYQHGESIPDTAAYITSILKGRPDQKNASLMWCSLLLEDARVIFMKVSILYKVSQHREVLTAEFFMFSGSSI